MRAQVMPAWSGRPPSAAFHGRDVRRNGWGEKKGGVRRRALGFGLLGLGLAGAQPMLLAAAHAL